jgi:hypothetical protein
VDSTGANIRPAPCCRNRSTGGASIASPFEKSHSLCSKNLVFWREKTCSKIVLRQLQAKKCLSDLKIE